MTLAQIEYFIVAAECLNLTAAAKKLYISQPALGRQIAAMEEELGAPLFVRGKHSISLTPIGTLLQSEFSSFIVQYNNIIQKVHAINTAETVLLRIGVLSDHTLGDFFPRFLQYFRKNYPNIHILMESVTFHEIVSGLYNDKFDVIYTLDYSVADRPDLLIHSLCTEANYLAINNSLYNESACVEELSSFRQELFIFTSPQDSSESFRFEAKLCRDAGFEPQFKLADSLQMKTFWVENGYGIAILSGLHILANNPFVRFIPLKVSESDFVIAYHRGSQCPAVQLCLEVSAQLFTQH